MPRNGEYFDALTTVNYGGEPDDAFSRYGRSFLLLLIASGLWGTIPLDAGC